MTDSTAVHPTSTKGPGRTTPAGRTVHAIRQTLAESPEATNPRVITSRKQWEALLRWIEKH